MSMPATPDNPGYWYLFLPAGSTASLDARDGYQPVRVVAWLEGKAVIIGLRSSARGIPVDRPSMARFSELRWMPMSIEEFEVSG